MSIDIKLLKSACACGDDSINKKVHVAASNAGVEINLEEISDLQKTMQYGTRHFPTLVIDGELYRVDEIEKPTDLEQLLLQAES